MSERWVPPSVRYGSRGRRLAWAIGTVRERLALGLAPWLGFRSVQLTSSERVYEEALCEIMVAAGSGSQPGAIASEALLEVMRSRCVQMGVQPPGPPAPDR